MLLLFSIMHYTVNIKILVNKFLLMRDVIIMNIEHLQHHQSHFHIPSRSIFHPQNIWLLSLNIMSVLFVHIVTSINSAYLHCYVVFY